jgi:hypothetical protein
MNESGVIQAPEEQVLESSIDFPSEDLPLDIWDKKEDSYILKPELKEKILDALKQYPDMNLLELADTIRIVGSIGTDLYNEDADIDIHIVPKFELLPKDTDLEEFQRTVMNWFKNERAEKNWFVNSHPFEVYIQLDPYQDLYSDTVYDLLSDTWIKTPKKYGAEYNPYQTFDVVMKDLDDLTAAADIQFGKLRRAVYDHAVLTAQVAKIGEKQAKILKEQIEAKKAAVIAIIEELKANKEIWRSIRRRNSAQGTGAETPAEAEHSDAWKNDNALFKFLDRYGYIETINALSKLVEDNTEITEEHISNIPEILFSLR